MQRCSDHILEHCQLFCRYHKVLKIENKKIQKTQPQQNPLLCPDFSRMGFKVVYNPINFSVCLLPVPVRRRLQKYLCNPVTNTGHPSIAHTMAQQHKHSCPFRASGESGASVIFMRALSPEQQNALTSLSCCWHLAHC